VKIGPVVVEVFREICQFFPSRPKRCSFCPRNLWGVGVTGPILTKLTDDAATILPLNIFESELPYSYPFRNTSLPSESQFASFAQNWLPWQHPLRNWKKRSSSIIYEQIPIIW